MESTQFISYLAAWRPLVESWIDSNAWSRAEGSPVDLDSYLYGPLAHFNAGGGKRVRPILALLGCEAVGSIPHRALAAGCAIELFQSAALIHDDIADKSELRRGEPCLHISEGTGLAINAGDAALVEAFCAILNDKDLDAPTRLSVLSTFADMQRRTLEGQALDLGWVRDGRWDLTENDYRAMATLKTAHYSCASPLVIGAICGGGTAGQITALESFGLDAGLAFQIQDDLLNLTGNPETQGKDYLSDITEGKRTLPVLYTLEHLEGQRRSQFLEIISSGTNDEGRLLQAVDIMREAGALDHARAVAQELVDAAINRIVNADIAGNPREVLISMAHYFVERAG